MPKASKYPRLRVYVKRGKAGQVWTSYAYDNRGTGKPDVALGNDRKQALKQWDELHNNKPRIAGTLEEAFGEWEKDVLPLYEKLVTRKGYAQNLSKLRPVFGRATWDQVTLPILKQYLKKRTAKTQANREISLLSIIWNWARTEGMTEIPFPAHGMNRSKWKNRERAREVEVTDELFNAIYAEADETLRDGMDLATATGLRLTDCREVPIPPGNVLRVGASKTGKHALFEVSASPVLSRLVEKRRAHKAAHLKLLTTPTGKEVSERMLRDRFAEARRLAAAKPENKAIADELRGLILRDMRKRAAQLAGDVSEASKLLQHSSEAVTRKHYRQGDKVRPVR